MKRYFLIVPAMLVCLVILQRIVAAEDTHQALETNNPYQSSEDVKWLFKDRDQVIVNVMGSDQKFILTNALVPNGEFKNINSRFLSLETEVADLRQQLNELNKRMSGSKK